MKIRYARQAVSDLVAIADYIRERNPAAPADVEAAIRTTIGMLADHPKIGHERRDLDARAIIVPSYPYAPHTRPEQKRR